MPSNIFGGGTAPNNPAKPPAAAPEAENRRQPPFRPHPAPLISANPPLFSLTAFKQLSAYPNYGNPSRNADILYTGTRGAWNIELPPFMLVPGRFRAQLVIRAVLDDHMKVPVSRYSARITINGTQVHNGRLPLEHGAPAGGMFVNWGELTFNIPNPGKDVRIIIENTSAAAPGDWIGLDWIELRQHPR